LIRVGLDICVPGFAEAPREIAANGGCSGDRHGLGTGEMWTCVAQAVGELLEFMVERVLLPVGVGKDGHGVSLGGIQSAVKVACDGSRAAWRFGGLLVDAVE
jgi:hypothetical protein